MHRYQHTDIVTLTHWQTNTLWQSGTKNMLTKTTSVTSVRTQLYHSLFLACFWHKVYAIFIFGAVQFKMLSMRSGCPICAPPRLSDVFARRCLWNSLCFKKYCRAKRSFRSSLLPGHRSVVWYILGLRVSRAPQHFWSCEMQAACAGFFARCLAACSVTILTGLLVRVPSVISNRGTLQVCNARVA